MEKINFRWELPEGLSLMYQGTRRMILNNLEKEKFLVELKEKKGSQWKGSREKQKD